MKDAFLKEADELERKEAAAKQGKGKKSGSGFMDVLKFIQDPKKAKKVVEKKSGDGFFDALLEPDPEKRKKIQEDRQQQIKSTISRAVSGPKLGLFGFGKPPMKLVTTSGKVHRGAFHQMSDGAFHSGKTHTKRSRPLFVKM